MKYFVFVIFFFATAHVLAQNTLLWQQEVQEIDAEIKQLREKKYRARANAKKHQDLAARAQFQSGRVEETRQAWEWAERELDREQELKQQLDGLEQKRRSLIQTVQNPSKSEKEIE